MVNYFNIINKLKSISNRLSLLKKESTEDLKKVHKVKKAISRCIEEITHIIMEIKYNEKKI